MKPACSPRGRRAALAAARSTLRADVGWLRGFPLGRARGGALPWRVVPAAGRASAPHEVAVDRDRLRAASGALARLPRRFPRALPALVGGEAATFVERAREVLGWLGAAVHEGAPLPGVAERLAGLDPAIVADALARPAVGPLVDALAWVHALDPERLAAALGEVVPRAEGLGRLVEARPDAVALTVGLLDLALDAPRGPAASLLALLGREAPWTAALEADAAPLEALAADLERRRPAAADDGPPPRPAAPLGSTLVDLAGDVLRLEPAARDRTLAVLVAVVPDALVERWAAWWADVAARAVAARRRLAGPPGGAADREERRALARALRALARARPSGAPAWQLQQATRAAARLSPAAGERLLHVLARVDPLAAPSWAAAARLALVTAVSDRRHDPARGLGVLAQVLRAAPGAFGGDVVMLALELVDEGARLLRHAPLVVEALTDLARRRGRLDPALGLTLALEHAARVGDARRAAAFLRAAEAAGVSPRNDLPPLLVALCGRDPARLPAVLGALGKAEWPRAQADALAALTARDDARALLCDALAAGEVARVRRLGQWAAVIAGLGEALHTAAPAAPADDQLDARAALAREAAALEGLVPSAPEPRRGWMRRRLARLRARLAGHDDVPARRRRAAARRARARHLRAALDAWCAALERRAAAALAAWLGQAVPDAWLACPRRAAVLAGLVGLPARDGLRALAARVLRARLGPPPWDLRDARENRAFLARLRARGLDPRAWVEGLPARAWTPPGGPRLTLRLEDDPLEVLRMGEPFRTCLAPGAFNFFAALVDAADVNKRVLYARRDDGAIVGRCLLALTDAGALLTYHPYCHDAALGFVEQVRAFVRDLAAAVRTTVAASGDVSTLLAGDWYCDEPEDLVGARPITADALREVLASATPDDVAARLEDALGPALDGEVLARVLALSTLEERPALALGLAPLVVTRRAPPRARVAAAERLVAAGAPEAARALVHGVRPEQVDALHAARLADVLLALGRAHAAHQALRRSAPRGGEEHAAERLAAWGAVGEALHRLAAAREHYARGAAAPGGEAARARCRARLEALSRARAG